MLSYKKYGQKPYRVIVLHGGPGAVGQAAPMARTISKEMGVVEHLQLGHSIEDLKREIKEIIQKEALEEIILVGHSWGAWLAWIFAASYPKHVKKLVLISAGSFDEKYNRDLNEIRLKRLSPDLRKEAIKLMEKLMAAPDDRIKPDWFRRFSELMERADSYHHEEDTKDEAIDFKPQQYLALWPEAAGLRKSGELLKMAHHIICPVVAFHGAYDSHPAKGVEVPLKKRLTNFRFIKLEKCGHYPWKEKQAKEEFYWRLNDTLSRG